MDQFLLVLVTLLIYTAGEGVHVLGEGSTASQKHISATVKVSSAELQNIIALRPHSKKEQFERIRIPRYAY